MRLLVYEVYGFQKITGELRSVLYLLKHLDRSRFDPLVVLPFTNSAFDGERRRGTEVLLCEPPASLRVYGGALLRRSVWQRLRVIADVAHYSRTLYRVLRSRQIDVVYCCSLRALLLIGFAARLARTPVLFVVNGALTNPLLDTIAYCLASRIVFQCAVNRDDRYPRLRRWFRRKLDVVQSGLNLSLIQEAAARAPSAEALGVDPRDVNIAVVGLLHHLKGVHFLIEAIRRLHDGTRRMRLWIVGDQITSTSNDYRTELEAQVSAAGLQEIVIFTGWRKDAIELVAAMDVVAHPSLSEGMPRAVLEAMGLGKAVVATRVGCLREVVRDKENGLLVQPGNVDELTVAIGALVSDPALRASLGRAAANTIARQHSIEDKIRQLEERLAALVNATGRAAAAPLVG